MTDAKRRKNQPTIHSWVAAKKLRDFYFSFQYKKLWKKERITLTIAKEKEKKNANDGLNLWRKKRALSERIRWKCPLFHGSFVLIGAAEKKC